MKFAPFSNESDVITIGELTIENHEGSIALVGNTTITRTKQGLAAARVLLDVMQRAVSVMTDDAAAGKLSDQGSVDEPVGHIKNPFLGQ